METMITTAIVGGVIWVLTKLALGYRYQIHKDRLVLDKERLASKTSSISLISKQASEHLISALNQYQEQNTSILNDISKQLADLNTSSKRRTKQTV